MAAMAKPTGGPSDGYPNVPNVWARVGLTADHEGDLVVYMRD